MKKYLTLLTLAVLFSGLASAQETVRKVRYRGDVGLHLGASTTLFYGASDPSWMAVGSALNTTHGVEFNEAATLGVGAALGAGLVSNFDANLEMTPVISLYLHFDYAFLHGKTTRPWIGFRAGYGGTSAGHGPNAGVGFGMRIKNSWDLGLWYRQIIGYTDGQYYFGFTPFIGFAWRFPGYKK